MDSSPIDLSKFLKQTFHEFAKSSIPHCGWANAFYRLQRQRGHDHHQAIRALAYQWIRILTRCWAAHTPYCEDTYLQALRRSSSPLIAFMEADRKSTRLNSSHVKSS